MTVVNVRFTFTFTFLEIERKNEAWKEGKGREGRK
jgi:hypothetical protein